MTSTLAEAAISAWGKGENSGNYTEFKALLSDKFDTFSHPLMGKFTGNEAIQKINGLIADREKVSNNLTFSDIKISTSNTSASVQFNSKGIVQGKFPYESFNIIVLHFQENKISGFQEYFGFVDPNWFK
jgi:hypothetical protein